MYKSFFGFGETPFAITPDPKFLYLSQRHQDALAHLKYGLFETNGFVLLTGEVGTGKTALCRCLLQQLPETMEAALILNPRQTALELLANICDELHIRYPHDTNSIKVFVDLLNKHLLENHAQGRRTILIIDEAQNLSDEVMEQIRLLTNLETTKRKLLQILLAGQPELQAMLSRPQLRQLTQRITARYHIAPLTLVETGAYIRHRMGVAGVERPIFSKNAIAKIFKLCRGIPRLINIICDRALLGAYAQNSPTIDIKIVNQAAQEVLPEGQRSISNHTVRVAAVAMLLVSFAVAAYTLRPWERLSVSSQEEVAVAAVSKPPEPESKQPGLIESAPAVPPPPKSVIVPVEENIDVKENIPVARNLKAAALVAKLDMDISLPVGKDHGEVGAAESIREETTQIEAPGIEVTASRNSSLIDLMNNQNCSSNTAVAISALFQLWGKEYQVQSDRTPCDIARDEGLRCMHSKGTWNNLRRYNRPAIVELLNPEGNWQHLLVSEINGDSIKLSCGADSATITIGQVDQYWLGEFLLLWKSPKYRSRFQRGNSSYEVQQFRQRLESAMGITHPVEYEASRVFDEELEQLVIQFQRANSLQPDGVAGRDSLILLNTLAADPSIPRLQYLTQ